MTNWCSCGAFGRHTQAPPLHHILDQAVSLLVSSWVGKREDVATAHLLDDGGNAVALQ